MSADMTRFAGVLAISSARIFHKYNATTDFEKKALKNITALFWITSSKIFEEIRS
jgi:hypothetical protein